MRSLGFVVFACVLLPIALHAQAQTPATSGGARRVVLVTIDGRRGDYLGSADAYQLRIDNLRRLMREGSWKRG